LNYKTTLSAYLGKPASYFRDRANYTMSQKTHQLWQAVISTSTD